MNHLQQLNKMQAHFNLVTLISYSTEIAKIRHNSNGDKILHIWDYPTNTSKKHLRKWLEMVFSGRELERVLCYIKIARKRHQQFIMIYLNLEKMNSGQSYKDMVLEGYEL